MEQDKKEEITLSGTEKLYQTMMQQNEILIKALLKQENY